MIKGAETKPFSSTVPLSRLVTLMFICYVVSIVLSKEKF